MKKNLLIGAATLIVSIPTFAGDYLTNTNQNAAFLRMVARGASIDIDGVYSNPAGLAFLLLPAKAPTRPVKSWLPARSGPWTEILPNVIIKVQHRLLSFPASTEPTRKTDGSSRLHSPSPAEAEKLRSTMAFRCSMPWLQV